jgi:uncharacterized protein (UPF0333 family)
MEELRMSRMKSTGRKIPASKNLLIVVSLTILIMAAAFIYVSYLNGKPVPEAEAKSKIINQLKGLKLTGTVIHRVNVLKMYNADGKVYNTVTSEIWEDNDSDRYKLITKYQDATVTTSFDGMYEYDYDSKAKTLRKTEVVDTYGRQLKKRGYRSEMINWLNEILIGDKVSAVEKKVDGIDMFVLT